MARPTKYTPETAKKVCDAIRAGNYKEAAARYAGLNPETVNQWLRRYPEFSAMVHEAEAAAEVRIVAQWQQQIPQNWQAAKDFLARRYPERWAETHKIVQQVEKELGKALDLLADNLSEDEYARVVAILANADGARSAAE